MPLKRLRLTPIGPITKLRISFLIQDAAPNGPILKVSTAELLLDRKGSGEDLPISDVRLLDKFQRLQEFDKRDRDVEKIVARSG